MNTLAISWSTPEISMLVHVLLAAMMQTPRDSGKGSELFRNCQAAIREVDATNPADSDLVPANHCSDYVSGFAEGLSAGGAACFERASKATMIRIYVNFMQRNPKYMDESAGVGFYISMLQSFPCKKP